MPKYPHSYWTFVMICALLPWFAVNNIPASYPRVKSFFKALRSETKLQVFAVGFCWGGKHVLRLAGDEDRVNGKSLMDAGFTGHPSLMSLPGDIEKVKVPVSFALGDQDRAIPMKNVEII